MARKNFMLDEMFILVKDLSDFAFSTVLSRSGKHIININELKDGESLLHKLVSKNMSESVEVMFRIKNLDIDVVNDKGLKAFDCIKENQGYMLSIFKEFMDRAKNYASIINPNLLELDNDFIALGINGLYSSFTSKSKSTLLDIALDSLGKSFNQKIADVIIQLIYTPGIHIFKDLTKQNKTMNRLIKSNEKFLIAIFRVIESFNFENLKDFLSTYPMFLFSFSFKNDYFSQRLAEMYNKYDLLESCIYEGFNAYHYAVKILDLHLVVYLDNNFLDGRLVNSRRKDTGETPLYTLIDNYKKTNQDIIMINCLLANDNINLNIKNFITKLKPLELARKKGLMVVVGDIEKMITNKAKILEKTYDKLREDVLKFRKLNNFEIVSDDILEKMDNIHAYVDCTLGTDDTLEFLDDCSETLDTISKKEYDSIVESKKLNFEKTNGDV